MGMRMNEDDNVRHLPAQGFPAGEWVVNRSWLVLAWLLVVTLALLLALVGWRYYQLRSQVDQACGGVVARLDLSEWVPLCR